MLVLDELSGFEFEDVMEDVFRNLGYENVHQAARTADEGRDVLMEEVVDGERRGIVVECKHTDSVGRPVVQKLHSAVATYDFDAPTRGIVATTGRFTQPAREYAQRLRETDNPHPIDLIDGEDLREFADEIGLDLYNGRIEILCDDTLRPYDPATSLDERITAAMRDIENLDAGDVPDPHARVTFRPTVIVTAETDATFETSVGVIHQIHERNHLAVQAERSHLEQLSRSVAEFVTNNRHATVELDDAGFGDVFDEVETRRFGETQTEYKEWAIERLREHYTTTVSYTGDNNVTYEKTGEPNRSDVTVHSVEAVYLPDVRQTTELGEYAYPLEYYCLFNFEPL